MRIIAPARLLWNLFWSRLFYSLKSDAQMQFGWHHVFPFMDNHYPIYRYFSVLIVAFIINQEFQPHKGEVSFLKTRDIRSFCLFVILTKLQIYFSYVLLLFPAKSVILGWLYFTSKWRDILISNLYWRENQSLSSYKHQYCYPYITQVSQLESML